MNQAQVNYQELLQELTAVFEGERNWIANTANCAALLYHALPEINWAGFYFLHDEDLVLGPFQGKPACVRIAVGKGVCGTAAKRRETIVVPNVHEFPGHIACDVASQAEIVIPLLSGSQLLGVMDLDSPVLQRFTSADQVGLEAIAAALIAASDIP
jgi:L-methionine (R)-S-oxide reductase